jgi:outer membrane protein OmpA-like peptidoglycan-associated protein
VKQYVRAAMTELLADIERKLSGAKPSAFETRAKALGVTVPELLLNETQALKVDELFLVKRGSGELVAHWERSTNEGGALTSSGGNRDVLIAGYLSGIMSFSEEAFDDRKGSLRSLDMDGERIFVRASPAYLLAARCSGRAPAAVERVVDDAFVDVLGRYREVLTAGGDPPAVSELLPALAQRCETDLAKARADLEAKARETAPPRGRGRLYALLTLLLLPLLAWFAWSTWQAWETRRVQGLADAVIAGTPELRGFPVRADVSSGGTVVALRGLTPDANVRTTLAARLQRDVTGSEIRNELGTLPERIAPVLPPDTSQDVAALREALATARRQLGETADRLATVAAQAARLPEVQARADAAVATLERQLDELRRRPVGSAPAPLMLLVEYIRTNAVFFGNGTDLLDEARAASTIDGLVTRLRATDAMLRVVGYTDERGQNQANQALALARADRIAALLIARGVDRERISTVGRTAGLELSRATGPGSPNRRVEFELGFIGEPRTP